MTLQGILTKSKLGHYFVTKTRFIHELFIILLFNLFGSIVVSSCRSLGQNSSARFAKKCWWRKGEDGISFWELLRTC
jgi:hypothetical protein